MFGAVVRRAAAPAALAAFLNLWLSAGPRLSATAGGATGSRGQAFASFVF